MSDQPPLSRPEPRAFSELKSRVSDYWLATFEADGKVATWPEVQSMARELIERRKKGP